jgi:hypothetical protein
MALTLAEARAVVSDHLDDDGTRWATAKVDTGLSAALSACLRDYVDAGKDALAEQVNASSTTAGVLDLSTYKPIKIHSISVKVGTTYYPVRAVDPGQRERDDTTARDCYVYLTRDFALPSNTGHPLVGIGATAAGASHAFDQWVCARAALYLSTKDDDDRAPVARMVADLRDTCLKEPIRPSSRMFAPPPRFYTRLLRWYYNPRTGGLHLCRSWSA